MPIKKIFELIRDEATNRLTKHADYPGKLCEVSLEVSQLIMNEMAEFREAERWMKQKSST
jgi:N-acetylmuramoyl-L-alanine amidase CwlA